MASIERTSTTKTYTVSNSAASPHSIVITRSRTSRDSTDGKSTRLSTRGGGGGGAVQPYVDGGYVQMTATGVESVKSSRQKEKTDMRDLNDRFANYIDRVRMLEAQNRQLADELDKLKTKWGKETAQIKAMYQAELDEARRALDDAEEEKARLDVRASSLEEEIEDITMELTLLQTDISVKTDIFQANVRTIGEYEREIEMLRRQLEMIVQERTKDEDRIAMLKLTLVEIRQNLDLETLGHINAENRRQTIEEEIEFIKSIHDQEMKELAALISQASSEESRDFWKAQMALAIKEIEQMYADKMEFLAEEIKTSTTNRVRSLGQENESRRCSGLRASDDCKGLRDEVVAISAKIQALQDQNAQLQREIEALRRAKEDRERELDAEGAMLRSEADELRSELEAILRELQMIMDSKMGLELEIAAYRKLLESEELRTGRVLPVEPEIKKVEKKVELPPPKPVVVEPEPVKEEIPSPPPPAPEEEEKGSADSHEVSAKTTFQRAAKGAIAIVDCPPDGRVISIENTGKKVKDIHGWKICRVVDGMDRPEYVLDDRFQAFGPGAKIGIWAKGRKPGNAGAQDIEIDTAWGIGMNITTSLVNVKGEERASLIQSTVYA